MCEWQNVHEVRMLVVARWNRMYKEKPKQSNDFTKGIVKYIKIGRGAAMTNDVTLRFESKGSLLVLHSLTIH